MESKEKKTYKEFITYRIEAALQQLDDNPAYMEQCRKQNRSEEVVEKLLHKLGKKKHITIRRHYEGETVKENFELDAAYIQGMRDCVQILSFLNAFHVEVCI